MEHFMMGSGVPLDEAVASRLENMTRDSIKFHLYCFSICYHWSLCFCRQDDQDNIPMRIMLLLMDEVFDLKSRNQWLRRRIVAILRQIIKATMGDSINRKIVDQVEFLTSADQVAEYVKKFRYSVDNWSAVLAPFVLYWWYIRITGMFCSWLHLQVPNFCSSLSSDWLPNSSVECVMNAAVMLGGLPS